MFFFQISGVISRQLRPVAPPESAGALRQNDTKTPVLFSSVQSHLLTTRNNRTTNVHVKSVKILCSTDETESADTLSTVKTV